MDNWREVILAQFVPGISKLTLVADPDHLFTEEKLGITLTEKGFKRIEFNDPIEFRFFYESYYRQNQGFDNNLVVVLGAGQVQFEKLPYDLLKTGRTLHFSLGEIFPNLSYPIIEQLDRSYLDNLFAAQKKNKPDRMGDNATKDFILRHVYKIAAELISTKIDLLRILLRLHYSHLELPVTLSNRLTEVLSSQAEFHEWPLEEIIEDGQAFLAFLQERWPIFLDSLKALPNQIDEDYSQYGLKFKGPEILPFGHQDILVYMDNLFVERKLTPVTDNSKKLDLSSWIKSGVFLDDEANKKARILRLIELLEEQLPNESSRHAEWTSFALKKAELDALTVSEKVLLKDDRFLKLKNELEGGFTQWLENHFSGLINLPPTQPVMLHHTPRQMARSLENSGKRGVALIVVDGLSLNQWVCVRNVLQEQSKHLVMRESAVFAWIPTLTSVSRQALFAGKPPLYFPNSIHTTHNEKKLWQQFWENFGLSRLEVGYQKSLGDKDAVKALEKTLNLERIRALGLVIDTVDKIMHGMQLGNAGMHNQIRQWCESGILASLIDYLHEHEFEVWLTSDHGNIECKGMGNPLEGAIAESKGERARIYPTPELRSQVAKNFPDTAIWHPAGLPSKYYPLLAKGTNAFINQGKNTVTHGGFSIEEVIVPLIKFEKE
jgi:PglZ domain-containing protein